MSKTKTYFLCYLTWRRLWFEAGQEGAVILRRRPCRARGRARLRGPKLTQAVAAADLER